MGDMGLVAGIGGFILFLAIAFFTIWTKARKPTASEDRARDEGTRDLYGKDSQSNDSKR